MLQIASRVAEAATFVRDRCDSRPKVGLILGSGLGRIAAGIDAGISLPYAELPHFPRSTVMGHDGQLVCGRIGSVGVCAMQGRVHCYEGYTQAQVTFPVRVMKALGVELLIVTCAAGGLNPLFETGDILLIDDHINLMFDNPLIGVNDERLGPRFPDMSRPYDEELIALSLEIARRENFSAHRGVYAAVKGPNYEPRAEYRLLRGIGADAVGMSTVPEVIVAVHAGLRVLGISVISNVCTPSSLAKTTGEQVVAAVERAERKVRTILHGVLARVAEFSG